MIKTLELFKGNGIVSQVAEKRGHDIVTLDCDPRTKPDICTRIQNWPYQELLKDFTFIWASPDCGTFSRSALPGQWQKTTIKYRRYDYTPINDKTKDAMEMINVTLDIIDYFRPKFFVIENPVGRLRHIKRILSEIPYRYSVNYKDWGFDYSKETDLFTNFMLPFSSSVPLRIGKSVNKINGSLNRAKVPALLINFIFDYCNL